MTALRLKPRSRLLSVVVCGQHRLVGPMDPCARPLDQAYEPRATPSGAWRTIVSVDPSGQEDDGPVPPGSFHGLCVGREDLANGQVEVLRLQAFPADARGFSDIVVMACEQARAEVLLVEDNAHGRLLLAEEVWNASPCGRLPEMVPVRPTLSKLGRAATVAAFAKDVVRGPRERFALLGATSRAAKDATDALSQLLWHVGGFGEPVCAMPLRVPCAECYDVLDGRTVVGQVFLDRGRWRGVAEGSRRADWTTETRCSAVAMLVPGLAVAS